MRSIFVYVCVLLVMLYLSVEFCHLTLFNSQREKLMWNSAFVGDRDGIFVFCSTTENFLQLWQPLFFFLHDSLYVHQAYEAYAFRLFTIDTEMQKSLFECVCNQLLNESIEFRQIFQDKLHNIEHFSPYLWCERANVVNKLSLIVRPDFDNSSNWQS